jgi:conjugative relaxase-like TrwC/TraI family protein
VTVSVKKLKVGGDELSAEQIVGYLLDRQDAGDYYSEEGQAFMRWFTNDRVKTRFALRGTFDRVALRYLIEGRNPVTGEEIRKVGGDQTRVAAIDLTVSPAPKSVSILWALADDPLRFEIELMVGKAVDAAVGRMLAEHPLVRRRIDGEITPVIADDYVVAQAFHTTARLSGNSRSVPDPQLHIHNLLIGALSDTGRLLAIESRYVMQFQAEVEAEATGRLAALFQERGFELELGPLKKRGNGQPCRPWELKGIPPSLIKAMSSRTTEIEDLKRQYTEATGREPIGSGWEGFVMSHRGPKARLTAPELRAEWEVDCAEHGLTPEMVDDMRDEATARRSVAEAVAREMGRRGIKRPKETGEEAAEFRRLMLEWICRDHAFVSFADMERLAHQLAVGMISPREADGVVAEMLGDGDLLVTTDRKVTTLAILSYEQRSRSAVQKLLAAEPGTAAADELIDAELARREADGAPLDEGQAAAVRLAVSGARFVSITGKAGTGKGYATSVMTDLWHASGRRVTALAVAGLRAQQAGADARADDAMTVDKLRAAMAAEADRLHGAMRAGTLKLDAHDVLLVDEAGMLDHHRYAPLLEAAVASGATLVQVGDDKQLSPVGPGGLWTVTHRQAQVAGKAVELRDIHRAHEEREKRAWDDLRDGRVAEALTWMAEQDRIRIYDTRPELLAGLVDAWWAGDRDGLMVTDTSNVERDQLNELAQARRLEAEELGAEAMTLSNGPRLHVGDRVLFNAIYRPGIRGVRRVENGTPAVVAGVNEGRGEVEVELSEPRRRPRRLVLGADAPVDLGYARHVVKAQGVTAEDTDLAVSRHTSHNELYVMATRARNGARVHAIVAELAEGLEMAPEQLRAAVESIEAGVSERSADLLTQMRARELLTKPRVPADRDPLLPAERRVQDLLSAPAPPAGATPVSEMLAAFAAERDRREREETVRQVSGRAARSSTKEAVGDRETTNPEAERGSQQRMRDVRDEGVVVRDVAREHDTERQWEASLATGRRQAPRTVAMARNSHPPADMRGPQRQPRRPSPALPARDAMESLGRGHMEAHDTARALAYYRAAGRLYEADDPAVEVAELLAADEKAIAVVQNDDQERRLREALAAQQLIQTSPANEADRWSGRIVLADHAYNRRLQRRGEWLEAMEPQRRSFAHMPEPGAIPRVYVMAAEPWASSALTRAVSVAAESHLVVPHLRPGLAQKVAAEEASMKAAQEDQARERSRKRAERARQLGYGRNAVNDAAPTATPSRGAGRGMGR